jgi:hypothetical protein
LACWWSKSCHWSGKRWLPLFILSLTARSFSSIKDAVGRLQDAPPRRSPLLRHHHGLEHRTLSPSVRIRGRALTCQVNLIFFLQVCRGLRRVSASLTSADRLDYQVRRRAPLNALRGALMAPQCCVSPS